MSTDTKQILLIECNFYITEIIQFCLETLPGWKVITVSSGSEAKIEVEKQRVDAIVFDLEETIPDMNWEELWQSLQQNPLTREIPVILLTETVYSSKVLRFKQMGVEAAKDSLPLVAIAKSFDLFNLGNQIATALNW